GGPRRPRRLGRARGRRRTDGRFRRHPRLRHLGRRGSSPRRRVLTMHLYYFRESARSMRQHRALATTAIVVLTAALALTGVFLLLTYNAERALELMGDRREMIVYLRDDLSPSDRDLLMGRLHDLYGFTTSVSNE